jgi:hypothetical protein
MDQFLGSIPVRPVEISNTMRKSFNTLAVLMQCDGDTIRQ